MVDPVLQQKVEESLLANPVASLQNMLRLLGFHYEFLPVIAIDGIFGEETLESVLLFQRELYPPVTGVVTQEVWSAIREEYISKTGETGYPKPLRAYPEGGISLKVGDQNETVVLVQTMFALLSNMVADITPEATTGKFTQTLQNNVKWLQRVSNLAETGMVNQATWDRLARLYEMLITAHF